MSEVEPGADESIVEAVAPSAEGSGPHAVSDSDSETVSESGSGSGSDSDSDSDPELRLTDTQLEHLLEALIFASDKPIPLAHLRRLANLRAAETARVEEALAALTARYAGRGIVLAHVSGGYQFRTDPEYAGWVQELVAGRPVRLSRAQLETLAIVAYRQPITRPEIDDIRGVDSSATLRILLERGLVRVLGKREEVGRPILYGTTKEFLDFFSLSDLRELPTLREYAELTDESRRSLALAELDDAPQATAEPGPD